jgi:hypothetical protein
MVTRSNCLHQHMNPGLIEVATSHCCKMSGSVHTPQSTTVLTSWATVLLRNMASRPQ